MKKILLVTFSLCVSMCLCSCVQSKEQAASSDTSATIDVGIESSNSDEESGNNDKSDLSGVTFTALSQVTGDAAEASAEAMKQGTSHATPMTSTSAREDSSDGAEEIVLKESAPHIPDTLDRVVIGADNRVTVQDTFAYPFSAIAMINVHARCGCEWGGTGFLIGPDMLLTASHVLVCTEHHKTADYMEFFFGYHPDGSYAYAYTGATKYRFGTSFPNGYTQSSMDWDYGVVQLLEDRVGDTTGTFGYYMNASDNLIDGTYLNVAGYRDGLLKTNMGKAKVVNGYLFSIDADTQPGNSGCPVFTNDYFVMGINVAENRDIQLNYVCRLSEDLFADMKEL